MRYILNAFTPVDTNEDVFKLFFSFSLHLFISYAFPSLLCTQVFPCASGWHCGKPFLSTKEGISIPEYKSLVGTTNVRLIPSENTSWVLFTTDA